MRKYEGEGEEPKLNDTYKKSLRTGILNDLSTRHLTRGLAVCILSKKIHIEKRRIYA